MFGSLNRKKKKQLSTEEIDADEEQQAEEEEVEAREAEVETAAIMQQDMERVKNDLDSSQEDSNDHPFRVCGLEICSIAESILKGFTPLETLTKAELASIVAKIDADMVSSQDLKGIRRKQKTLKRLTESILDFVERNCFCTKFTQQK